VAVQERLLTADEFEKLPNDGKKYELVRGALVEVCRPTGPHGELQSVVSADFIGYLRKNKIGRCTTESGFRLSPDTVRGPDVAFTSFERIEKFPTTGMIPAVPDLVVEIVSPEDTAGEIQDKVHQYLEAGTKIVWVFYIDAKAVHIFTPDGEPRVVGIDGVLDGENVMPGFRLSLREVFDFIS
jgi:Uma2 family endonuclease